MAARRSAEAQNRAVSPGARAGAALTADPVSQGHPAAVGPLRRKYGNVPTVVNGQRFASKREAARYQALAMLERSGAITDLETQVIYRFEVNGVKVGRYSADFRYRVPTTGEVVVEDSKGKRVRDWYRTKRLMLACYGITVREV